MRRRLYRQNSRGPGGPKGRVARGNSGGITDSEEQFRTNSWVAEYRLPGARSARHLGLPRGGGAMFSIHRKLTTVIPAEFPGRETKSLSKNHRYDATREFRKEY